ncbi:hypothetical protein [Limnofasciculus baicalensis]|uniref:Uncharacterized protein n=1 Tax=Limnofasciculus baicalensis BBK-W-15 TaxID=2699891 RepID=A0AAE3GVV2_9CYAN|nr:hypothetical protein [Limnofasciculus baicalensis]MCP2731334.1 hypothetical protein [Limnofasciculus baicalensis BBK-W-15]
MKYKADQRECLNKGTLWRVSGFSISVQSAMPKAGVAIAKNPPIALA